MQVHMEAPWSSPVQAVQNNPWSLWAAAVIGTDLDSQSVLQEGGGVPDGLLGLLGLLLGARVGKVKVRLAFGSCEGGTGSVSAWQHLLLTSHFSAWQNTAVHLCSGNLAGCPGVGRQRSCTVQMQQLAPMQAAMAAARRPDRSGAAPSLRASSFCWRTVSHCACHSLMRS